MTIFSLLLKKKWVRLALGITLFLFVPQAIYATGFETGDIGPTALGRGNAFVAKADNGSAFHYNPAGLAKQTGFNLLVGGNFMHMKATFNRKGSGLVCRIDTYACLNPYDPTDLSPDPSQQFHPPTHGEDPYALDPSIDVNTGQPYAASEMNKLAFLPLPMLVFTMGDLGGVKGLSLAIGFTSPSSFGGPDYGENGSQRYTITSSDLLGPVFGGVGLAYRINRYIQVGAVFNVGMAFITFSQKTQTVAGPAQPNQSELYADDASFTLELKDLFIPTGTLGILSNPVDWLEIGASVRLPIRVEAEGKVKMTATENDPYMKLVGDGNVVLTQDLPLIVRGGVRYIHQIFDVEVDYIFEYLDPIKEITADLDDATVELSTDDDSDNIVTYFDSGIPKNFRNTHTIRLGGDVEVLDDFLFFRAGGFFATSAYPKNNNTFSLDFPFGQQFGISGGLTLRVLRKETHGANLDLIAGYLHIFQTDVTVKKGIAQQNVMRSSADAPSTGNIVNNGDYEVSLNIFGLGAEANF